MTIRSVGFRMGVDGRAEVVNEFKAVEAAGQQTMDGIADAAEASADRSAKAWDGYSDRQVAAFKKQATAQKLAAAQAGTRSSFDDALAQPGNGGQFATVNLDRSTGGARASASVFQDAFAEQDRADREAAARATEAAAAEAAAQRAEDDRAATVVKLRAALDPLSAAQAQYARQVAALEGLPITEEERAQALKLYGDQLDATRAKLNGTAGAEEALAAQVKAFRASIDPAVAAQQRFDAEIGNARDLVSKGGISLDDYCTKLRQAQVRLREARDSLNEHSSALGLNRTQTMIAQSAGLRFADMILAGQSPIRAFALESHKLAEVLSFDDGGLAGGLAKARALVTPLTVGVAAGAVLVAVGTSAWLD